MFFNHVTSSGLLTCNEGEYTGTDDDVGGLHSLDLPCEILLTQVQGGK